MATSGAYTRIVVPVRDGPEAERAVRVACGLAANRGASITAVAVVEVPPLLPLDAHMVEEEEDARLALRRAEKIADSYGVALVGKILRAREAATAIIGQVDGCGAEVVVLGADRRVNRARRAAFFGRTAGAVLKGSPCPVVLVAAPVDGHYRG